MAEYCLIHQVKIPCNICDRLVTVTKPGRPFEAITKWEDNVKHSESGEWVAPNIVVIENGTFWYENTHGRALADASEAHGWRQDARGYKKPRERFCEFVWVTAPVTSNSNALAIPFNPNDLRGRVSEQTQQDCVDRANGALQAMRAHERKITGKAVLTEEERAESVRLTKQVHETQADVMIAVRNRSWQQHGIFPGMTNKRIAHVHVEKFSELPAALEAALKKRLSDGH
jgi:hypothetical protein